MSEPIHDNGHSSRNGVAAPRPGRPSKFKRRARAGIVRALRNGALVCDACRAAGVGQTTFKTWMERGRSKADADREFRAFRAAVKKARAVAAVAAMRAIRRARADGHWQAAAWFLERSNPGRWGRVDRLKAQVQADGDREVRAERDELRHTLKIVTDVIMHIPEARWAVVDALKEANATASRARTAGGHIESRGGDAAGGPTNDRLIRP